MTQLAINLTAAVILRQAHRAALPDPVHLAVAAELGGADAVSLHVREKRDMVTERDVKMLRQSLTVPLFMRMAPTPQMVGLALDVKPDLVTLVDEKPQALIVGGGIDLIVHREAVSDALSTLKDSGLTVCLSVPPDAEQVKIAHRLGAVAVDIHTGDFSQSKGASRDRQTEILSDAVGYAAKLKLGIHVGGGLDYPALKRLAALTRIEWFGMGHAVVARALLTGLAAAVKDCQRLLKDRPHPQ